MVGVRAPAFVALAESAGEPVAVWSSVLDGDGVLVDFRYEYVNAAAERVLGLPREELIGRRLLELPRRHVELGLFERYRRVALTGEPAVIDVPWFEDDTVAGSFEARVAPLEGGIVAVVRDVTEQRRVERRLSRSEQRVDVLLDHLSDAVFHIEDSTISWVSGSVTALLGWLPGDLIGNSSEFLLRDDDHEVLVELREGPHAANAVTQRIEMRTAAGGWRWMDNSIRPIVDDRPGARRAYVVVARDAGPSMAATAALAASESLARESAMRLHTLLEAVPIGVFETDREGICTFANPRAAEITGLGSAEDARDVRWIDAVRRADGSSIGDAWTALVDGGARFVEQLTYRRPDGRIVWMDVTVVPMCSVHTGTTSYLGTIEDITERRQLEHARFEAAELFAAAFDNAPTGLTLWGVDPTEPKAHQVNAAYTSITGRTADDLAALDVREIIDPEHLPALLAGRDALLAGAIGSHHLELRQLHADGRWMWVSLTRSIVRDADGRPAFLIAQVADITERREAEERIAALALTDPLTGLANRRQFEARLALAHQRLRREGGHLAVAFIDLDHFKAINDALGHEAGDELLCEVAATLRSCVRPHDVVARLGGDEFAVVVEGVGDEEIRRVADRISSSIDLHRQLPNGSTHRVTASIGIATSDGSLDDEPAVFLRRADRAMYRSKHAGRDGWSVDLPG